MDEGLVVTRRPRRRSPSPRSRSLSPRTPSPRRSFGPTDVFASPVEWSQHPSYDEDAVQRILAHGTTMCREEVTPFYIRAALKKNPFVWTVRDANRRIFGFALTKHHASYIDLLLICTHRRNGEGMRLFREILAFARQQAQEVRLEAVNAKVGQLYVNAALDEGHLVQVEDLPATNSPRLLADALRAWEQSISMRIWPAPGARFSHGSSSSSGQRA